MRAVLFSIFIILPITAWCAGAIWYRLPAPETVRMAVAGAMALLGVGVSIALIGWRRRRAVAAFGLVFGAVLIWWSTIVPPTDRNWSPDVARQASGVIEGNKLTLTNVRNFDWRSETDITERWETRSYDLSQLKSLDLFLSYWAGPEMAHVILSFGFEDGQYLAWSVEVRRSRGGEFSPIADLFKTNPLAIIAATEQDVVRVRSNVRGEDVQLYRLATSPQGARTLLLSYVQDANELTTTPVFYNSIATNCTTTIFKMIRALGDAAPLDWRVIVNGYLPGYLYEQGALDTAAPLETLRAASHIAKAAASADSAENFSKAIRVGVPTPTR